VGLRPSAIRYYERIGLLPAPQRRTGIRFYDSTVLHRLAVVQRARQLDFTLTEIRQLFFGFRTTARASARWRNLSRKKLSELDDLLLGIKTVRHLLQRMMRNCRCSTLDQCGQRIYHHQFETLASPFPNRKLRP
jgi:MerR family transcriptional regulator, redox-sensitive transcriptional activator SoxR